MGQLTTHVLDTSAGRPGAGSPGHSIGWRTGTVFCATASPTMMDAMTVRFFPVKLYGWHLRVHFEVGDTFAEMTQPSAHPPFLIRWSCALAFRIQTNTIMCRAGLAYGYSTYRAADRSFARPWLTQDLNSAACLAPDDPPILFDVHQTLLDFIRLEARLTGTKEGAPRETAARARY